MQPNSETTRRLNVTDYESVILIVFQQEKKLHVSLRVIVSESAAADLSHKPRCWDENILPQCLQADRTNESKHNKTEVLRVCVTVVSSEILRLLGGLQVETLDPPVTDMKKTPKPNETQTTAGLDVCTGFMSHSELWGAAVAPERQDFVQAADIFTLGPWDPRPLNPSAPLTLHSDPVCCSADHPVL